jgi:hypothetical protein
MIICNRSLCYDFRYLSLCFPLHRWIDVILWCTRFMLWGIYHMLALRHIVVPLWRSVYILTDYELCKCFVFKKKKKKKGGSSQPLTSKSEKTRKLQHFNSKKQRKKMSQENAHTVAIVTTHKQKLSLCLKEVKSSKHWP